MTAQAIDLYVLDTNVLSALVSETHSRHEDVVARLRSLDERDVHLFIAPMTAGELEYGITIAPNMSQARRDRIREEIRKVEVLAIDRNTAEPYGAIRGALFEKLGTRDAKSRVKEKRVEDLIPMPTSRELAIQENDLWIVSLSVQYDAVLLSLDARMRPVIEAAGVATAWERWEVM